MAVLPASRPMSAVRSVASMSDAELRASAQSRLHDLALRHGADSPQVAAAVGRWGRVLDSRSTADDTMALVEALAGRAR